MEQKSSADLVLLVLGMLAWAVAALFGAIPTTVETQVAVGDRGTAAVKAPSPSGAGAACGFAVAGGLCFVGAALTLRPGGGKPTACHADRGP